MLRLTAAQKPRPPHPPTVSATIPSVRCGVTTVGTNDPRFHTCPLEGVVVAPTICEPSTGLNCPVPSFRKNVVPHSSLYVGKSRASYNPTMSRKPSLLMSTGRSEKYVRFPRLT